MTTAEELQYYNQNHDDAGISWQPDQKKEEIKNTRTTSTTSPPLLVCTLYMLATHVVVIVIFIVTLAPGATGPAIIFIFSHIHFFSISWYLFSWWASSQESFQFLKMNVL